MIVTIDPGHAGDIPTEALREICVRALREEGVREDALLSLTVMSKDEIEELNRRYLGGEGPTDVIAFPMGEECDEGYLLGDVVICPEVIDGSGSEYEVEGGKELEYVVVHGVLHLLGYTDDDERGWQIMDRRQRGLIGLEEGESR